MSNTNLKIEDLGDEVGLSRVQLYRKVKALTGMTPIELLRETRLKRAMTLLKTTDKTVYHDTSFQSASDLLLQNHFQLHILHFLPWLRRRPLQ